MNLDEAQQLLNEAARASDAGRTREAVKHYSTVIAGLPRQPQFRDALIRCYDRVMRYQEEEGLTQDAFATFRQYLRDCAPACDDTYDSMYEEALLATGMPPFPLKRRERFFSLIGKFREALRLRGVVAECGCYRGLSSYLLCRYLKLAESAFNGHGYRIFDSFAGLSAPHAEDHIAGSDTQAGRLREMTRAGRFAAPLADVQAALAGFPGIEFFPGWIPGTFPDETGALYRFVHIDVDLYQPTRDGLEYFYDRLVPGGIIVCDDYSWPGSRKAIEEFCAESGVGFAVTPHEQACIVHP